MLSGDIEKNLDNSQCSILKVRAGIFLKPDCLSTLSSFLYQHENLRLLVFALPHDTVLVKDLVTSLGVIGRDSILLDLPKNIRNQIRALSGTDAFPDDDNFDSETSAAELDIIPNFPILVSTALTLCFYNHVMNK